VTLVLHKRADEVCRTRVWELAGYPLHDIMARFRESVATVPFRNFFPRRFTFCVFYALLLLSVSVGLQAQNAPPKLDAPPANSAKPQKKQPAKIKLTPEQEKALHLLDEAQANAAALQPGMKAFVLFEVGNTYLKFNKTKSRDLLQQAFLASLSMDDETRNCGISPACGVKGWVQMEILSAIAKDSPEEAEKLTVSAETPARNNMTAELVRRYVEAKNYEHAQDLLTQIADQPNYPYPIATTLILSFPKDQSAECQRVFGEAFANFNQYGTSGIIGTQDFGALILQTANRLPPQLVLEAIDKVLDEAKSNEFMKNMHLTIGSKSNDVSLTSLYQLRLFQLLPVLQQVDPSQADSLLRDDVQLRNILNRNPAGMGAFEPGRGGKGEPIVGQSLSLSGDAGASQFQAQREAAAQMMRRQGGDRERSFPRPATGNCGGPDAASCRVWTGFISARGDVESHRGKFGKTKSVRGKIGAERTHEVRDQLKDNQALFRSECPNFTWTLATKRTPRVP
jgi:hypothetical protein